VFAWRFVKAIRRQLLVALRAAFAWERLPPATAASAPARRGPGLLRMLFAIEPLPLDPPLEPRARGRWLRWLLTPEPLDPP
jgi:hypothetical protein